MCKVVDGQSENEQSFGKELRDIPNKKIKVTFLFVVCVLFGRKICGY